MSRSRVLILVLALVTAAVCVPPLSRADTGDRLRMVVWGMPFEDALFRDGYARDFERLHPGVEIGYEKYTSTAEKYLAWHILGTGADVMRVELKDYPSLVARGILAPLDAFLDDPEVGLSAADQADFMPAIWDALEIDGARYALPSDNAQYGLYYNRSIFADAGLPVPDASWTWGELRDAARRLTIRGDDGRVVQYGVDFDLWQWPFMAFFVQAGGRFWDDDGTTTRLDSPAGLAALEMVVELLPHAGAMRSADVKDSATGPDKLFAAGRTAILLDGSWRAPFLERVAPDLDFGIAPLPAGEHRAVVSGSVLWAVGAHSTERRLAWEMIRWMTTPEQSLRYWDMLRVAPPARMSVLRSEAFRATMPGAAWPDRGAWLLDAVTPDATGARPGFVVIGPYQKDLEEKINAMLSRAIAPGRREPLDAILRGAARNVHRVIDRDRRARGLPAVNRPVSDP